MGDASLAAAAAQAGLSAEELRELLDRDAQLAAASPAKRQRGLDGGSCSSGGGGSDLPPGWVEAKDARYNDKTYWYNKTTRSTSWTKPEWPPQPQPQRQWCDPTGLRQPQMQGALSPGRAGHGGGQADRNYGPSYGAVATQPPRAGYTPQRGAGYGGVVPQSGPRIETMLDAWVATRVDMTCHVHAHVTCTCTCTCAAAVRRAPEARGSLPGRAVVCQPRAYRACRVSWHHPHP